MPGPFGYLSTQLAEVVNRAHPVLQEQVDQQRLQEHQHANRRPQDQQQRSGQGGLGASGQPQQGQQRWQGGKIAKCAAYMELHSSSYPRPLVHLY